MAMVAAVVVSLTAGGVRQRCRRCGPCPAGAGRSAAVISGAQRGAISHDDDRRPAIPGTPLVLHPGTPVAPMTGEHAVMYVLTNRGSVARTLSGYPQIVLYDATGAALPFRYARGGGA